MNDLISRQAAISLAGDLQIHSGEYQQYNQAINNYCAELIKLPSVQTSYTDVEIQKMQDLESAQIEKAYQLGYEDGKKDAQPVDKDIDVPSTDTISRQQAIDALERKKDKNAKGDVGGFYNKIIQNDIDTLIQLPSAEPEIVRCKDCVYYGWDCVDVLYGMTGTIRWCNKFYTGENENIEVEPNDFCKWAERKADE